MTAELRSALAELSFMWAEAQSSAARYEQERGTTAAADLARRLDRVVSQAGMVKQALRGDVKVGITRPLQPAQVTDEHVANLRGLPVNGRPLAPAAARAVLEVGLGLRAPEVPS